MKMEPASDVYDLRSWRWSTPAMLGSASLAANSPYPMALPGSPPPLIERDQFPRRIVSTCINSNSRVGSSFHTLPTWQ